MTKKSFFLSVISAGIFASSVALAGPFDGIHDTSSGMNLSPQGTVFSQTLYREYVDLSKELNTFSSSKEAEFFNYKAVLAAAGSPVDPDAVMDRKLNASDSDMFSNSLNRLRVAFSRGAREFSPVNIGRAQVSYDCWMEAVEARNSERANRCQNRFEEAIVAAERVSVKDIVTITVSPPLRPLELDRPHSSVMPEPVVRHTPVEIEDIPQAVLDQYFLIPFEFDSTQMTMDGIANLQSAVQALSRYGSLRVNLTAHADRAGSKAYNQKLSERRADEVLTKLTQAGITANRVDIVESVGETRSLVPTEDGVPHEGNRVVELDLKR